MKTYKSYEIFLLNEIIESKILLFREIAKSKNTIIKNHSNREIKIECNKNIISIIIHNLLDNAVKNTPNGSIEIYVNKVAKDKLIIIKDTGNGMTNQQMKYYNEIPKNNENSKLILQKYGLGLHLVIQLLSIIDGELHFTKNFPKGTIATITIKNICHE